MATALTDDERHWALLVPLLPPYRKSARTHDHHVLVAVEYVVTHDRPWADVPRLLGVSTSAAYHQWVRWTHHQVWARLVRRALGTPDEQWAINLAAAATCRYRRHGPTRPVGPGPGSPAATMPAPSGRMRLGACDHGPH